MSAAYRPWPITTSAPTRAALVEKKRAAATKTRTGKKLNTSGYMNLKTYVPEMWVATVITVGRIVMLSMEAYALPFAGMCQAP
jgi:hypothetical protein